MEAARVRGTRIGRPAITQWQKNQLKKLREQGKGYKYICKKVGISKSKYYQILIEEGKK
jgi:DNA invertase Pin-like site-specific DNA recombinase